MPAAARGDAASLARDLRTFAREEPRTSAAIGAHIRFNETGGRDAWLITWLPGEHHLSLGIGHFIWYPHGAAGPFRESFADFLSFFDEGGGRLPDWLTPDAPCPWPNRQAFLQAAGDPRLVELRKLIGRTIDAQAAFLIERLARSLPALLAAVPPRTRARLERTLETLLRPQGQIEPDGVYALVDYVNFKGEGLSPGERYQGTGWGLLQVLSGMQEVAGSEGDPLVAFARSAADVLERRVRLSPPDRHEAQWLPGWLVRVGTYAEGLGRFRPAD